MHGARGFEAVERGMCLWSVAFVLTGRGRLTDNANVLRRVDRGPDYAPYTDKRLELNQDNVSGYFESRVFLPHPGAVTTAGLSELYIQS